MKGEEGCWSLCCKWKMEDQSLCQQCPRVVWGGTSSLLPPSFQTWQLLLCLFNLYKEKTSREAEADGSHVTGLCMDGISFSMTTVKWTACWHSKRRRTTNTNQFSPLTCFPLPKNTITGPYPGVPSSLLWIKDTGTKWEDKNLALHLFFYLFFFFGPLSTPNTTFWVFFKCICISG